MVSKLEFKKPGPSETFGNLTFSHDLIHQIGGQNDTNQNTTKRILLLLESCPLENPIVYNRVINSILKRYLEDDDSNFTSVYPKSKLPRFLLNDIIRFWRTMAVDYAHKKYERASKGWALRNIKLRVSRKLIFVSGLLVCFNCLLNKEKIDNDNENENALINNIKNDIDRTPLENLCFHLLKYSTNKDSTIIKILNNYEQFLTNLTDEGFRKHLENLSPEKAKSDEKFLAMKKISQSFQEGLIDFFFNENEEIKQLMIKYGVF
jgi:hypothetical protein